MWLKMSKISIVVFSLLFSGMPISSFAQSEQTVPNFSIQTDEQLSANYTALIDDIEQDRGILEGNRCLEEDPAPGSSEENLCRDAGERIVRSMEELDALEIFLLDRDARDGEICRPAEGFISDDILNLASDIEAIEEHQCTEEEKNHKKDVCGKEMTCAFKSSVLGMSGFLHARGLWNRLRGGENDKQEESGSECISSKNDCLTNVATALIDMVWTSLKDIVGLMGSALRWAGDKIGNLFWGASEDLENETSDAQANIQGMDDETARQAAEDPESFLKTLFIALMAMINEWLKTDIFCQEWSGTPHLGECRKPLEHWDCVGCGTMINGICSSTGAILGLLGESFATGGLVSILAKGATGAKVGVGILRAGKGYRAAVNSVKGSRFAQEVARGTRVAGMGIGSAARGTGRTAADISRTAWGQLRDRFGRIQSSPLLDKTKGLLIRTGENRIARTVGQGVRAVGRGAWTGVKRVDAVDTAAFNAGWAAVDTGAAAINRAARVAVAARRTAGAAAEMSDAARIARAEEIFGSSLTPLQSRALLDAHNVGRGEAGLDGNPAGVGNYTQTQISRKARILREAGFAPSQSRQIMEGGLAGKTARLNRHRYRNNGNNGSARGHHDDNNDRQVARAAALDSLLEKTGLVSYARFQGSPGTRVIGVDRVYHFFSIRFKRQNQEVWKKFDRRFNHIAQRSYFGNSRPVKTFPRIHELVDDRSGGPRVYYFSRNIFENNVVIVLKIGNKNTQLADIESAKTDFNIINNSIDSILDGR